MPSDIPPKNRTPEPELADAPDRARQTDPQDGHSGEEQAAFKPIYERLKENLIFRVLKGEWKPGEMLPAEKDLAIEYGHSQGTVRKAMIDMVAEGIVTRRSGRGTFVTSHAGNYQPNSFHPFYRNDGARVAEDTSLYVQCECVAASKTVSCGLGITEGALVSRIVRLRRSGDRTAVVETIYLSDELCPDAHTLVQRERPASLYAMLERRYNVLIKDVEEKVRARLATDAEAARLEIETESPILEVERRALSLGGHPIEWRIMVCQTNNFYYLRT